MNDELFSQLYKCTIERTYRKVNIFSQLPMYIGPSNDQLPYKQEDVIAIYMPESQVDELISEATKSEREREIRKQNPQLNELYIQYQMMLNLYK